MVVVSLPPYGAPVSKGAFLGAGVAIYAAGHPAKPLLARGVPAGSEGIMSTLLARSEAGPAASWRIGRSCRPWRGIQAIGALGDWFLAGRVMLGAVLIAANLPYPFTSKADLAHDLDLLPSLIVGLPDGGNEAGVGRAFALLSLLIRPRQHAQVRGMDHA